MKTSSSYVYCMYKLLQHEHIDKKTYNVIIYLNCSMFELYLQGMTILLSNSNSLC